MSFTDECFWGLAWLQTTHMNILLKFDLLSHFPVDSFSWSVQDDIDVSQEVEGGDPSSLFSPGKASSGALYALLDSRAVSPANSAMTSYYLQWQPSQTKIGVLKPVQAQSSLISYHLSDSRWIHLVVKGKKLELLPFHPSLILVGLSCSLVRRVQKMKTIFWWFAKDEVIARPIHSNNQPRNQKTQQRKTDYKAEAPNELQRVRNPK